MKEIDIGIRDIISMHEQSGGNFFSTGNTKLHANIGRWFVTSDIEPESGTRLWNVYYITRRNMIRAAALRFNTPIGAMSHMKRCAETTLNERDDWMLVILGGTINHGACGVFASFDTRDAGFIFYDLYPNKFDEVVWITADGSHWSINRSVRDDAKMERAIKLCEATGITWNPGMYGCELFPLLEQEGYRFDDDSWLWYHKEGE